MTQRFEGFFLFLLNSYVDKCFYFVRTCYFKQLQLLYRIEKSKVAVFRLFESKANINPFYNLFLDILKDMYWIHSQKS